MITRIVLIADDDGRQGPSDPGAGRFRGRDALIVLDQLRTVDEERLVKSVGDLPNEIGKTASESTHDAREPELEGGRRR